MCWLRLVDKEASIFISMSCSWAQVTVNLKNYKITTDEIPSIVNLLGIIECGFRAVKIHFPGRPSGQGGPCWKPREGGGAGLWGGSS